MAVAFWGDTQPPSRGRVRGHQRRRCAESSFRARVSIETAPRAISRWRFWQFTNEAAFNGTAATFTAGENRFNGTLGELRARTKPAFLHDLSVRRPNSSCLILPVSFGDQPLGFAVVALSSKDGAL
jgi:hypothetical protein